jgi:hypothetical protein
MSNSPVLFIIFNRPALTSEVFKSIKLAKPHKLYLAADGPREDRPNEKNLCLQARQNVLDNIDWECDIKVLLRDSNLGCRKAVSEAITWFFEHEEQGIILEDDTLPTQSFFTFCDKMLNHFKDDYRVMSVCGFNYAGKYKTEQTYFFSRFGGIWGWATWRRAWKFYHNSLSLWPDIKKEGSLRQYIRNPHAYQRRESIFDHEYRGGVDTWDYQWTFTKLIQNGLNVNPNHNLIKNLGFGEDATHTKSKNESIEKMSTYDMDLGEIIHPSTMIPDIIYEETFFLNHKPSKIPLRTHLKLLMNKYLSGRK